MLSCPWRIVLLAAVAVSLGSAASAQVTFNAPGFMPTKKPPPPPAPRARPPSGPELDPGAVLCRTQDDLDRYAANMTARVSGGETQAADCRIISQPTGIQILSREGPGSTQVQLSGDVTGWTNVWLPDKAPPGR